MMVRSYFFVFCLQVGMLVLLTSCKTPTEPHTQEIGRYSFLPSYGAADEHLAYTFYFLVKEGKGIRIKASYRYIDGKKVLQELYYGEGAEDVCPKTEEVLSREELQKVLMLLRFAVSTEQFRNFELAREYYIEMLFKRSFGKGMEVVKRGDMTMKELVAEMNKLRDHISDFNANLEETTVTSSAEMVHVCSSDMLQLIEAKYRDRFPLLFK